MLTPRQTARLAERVLATRYPTATCAFAAGSLIRGAGTDGSDLDLVVLFAQLPNAYRQSFTFESLPVEAFLHDPQTLAWELRENARVGRPAMPNMVAEARIVGPDRRLGLAWRRRAQRLMRAGPEPVDIARLTLLRYHITDKIGDLRDPRSRAETTALAAVLYDPIAELIARGRGLWAANGKWIPRRLAEIDADLAAAFEAAFDAVFAHGDAAPLIALAERVMAPYGGPLFDGYESHRSASDRIAEG